MKSNTYYKYLNIYIRNYIKEKDKIYIEFIKILQSRYKNFDFMKINVKM